MFLFGTVFPYFKIHSYGIKVSQKWGRTQMWGHVQILRLIRPNGNIDLPFFVFSNWLLRNFQLHIQWHIADYQFPILIYKRIDWTGYRWEKFLIQWKPDWMTLSAACLPVRSKCFEGCETSKSSYLKMEQRSAHPCSWAGNCVGEDTIEQRYDPGKAKGKCDL